MRLQHPYQEEVLDIRRPIGIDKAKGSIKKKGPRSSGSSSTNDEALATLMVSDATPPNGAWTVDVSEGVTSKYFKHKAQENDH
nr:hypothetical protein [Tanacetum cinerariifolium]